MSYKNKRNFVLREQKGTILLFATVIIPLLQTFAGRYTSAGLRTENNNQLITAGDNIHHYVPVTAGRSAPPQGDRLNFNSCDEYDWLDELIEKIWRVESSGRLAPPDGDGGKAAGPLQIHKAVVDDVNFNYRKNFTYADRYDLKKAKQIAKLYMQLWMERHKEEIAARIFNGGPRGWRKKSTDTYWAEIQK